jgi:hypothetical protein
MVWFLCANIQIPQSLCSQTKQDAVLLSRREVRRAAIRRVQAGVVKEEIKGAMITAGPAAATSLAVIMAAMNTTAVIATTRTTALRVVVVTKKMTAPAAIPIAPVNMKTMIADRTIWMKIMTRVVQAGVAETRDAVTMAMMRINTMAIMNREAEAAAADMKMKTTALTMDEIPAATREE